MKGDSLFYPIFLKSTFLSKPSNYKELILSNI